MCKSVVYIILYLLLQANFLQGQVIYSNDSVGININYKNGIVVNQFSDLDIDVIYTVKSRKAIKCYDYLISERKSTFGNCYFELWKLDSNIDYQDITLTALKTGHPPKDFKDREEILKYDIPRSVLKSGQKRVLTVNVFDFSGPLSKGKYVLTFYLRVANNYGYNANGEVVTNSITYLESTPVVFELKEDMLKINESP